MLYSLQIDVIVLNLFFHYYLFISISWLNLSSDVQKSKKKKYSTVNTCLLCQFGCSLFKLIDPSFVCAHLCMEGKTNSFTMKSKWEHLLKCKLTQEVTEINIQALSVAEIWICPTTVQHDLRNTFFNDLEVLGPGNKHAKLFKTRKILKENNKRGTDNRKRNQMIPCPGTPAIMLLYLKNNYRTVFIL